MFVKYPHKTCLSGRIIRVKGEIVGPFALRFSKFHDRWCLDIPLCDHTITMSVSRRRLEDLAFCIMKELSYGYTEKDVPQDQFYKEFDTCTYFGELESRDIIVKLSEEFDKREESMRKRIAEMYK